MKRTFYIALVALTLLATGCGKDGEKTYDVPTASETKIEDTNVVRTQVITKDKKAVEITYFFDKLDESVKYNHQEWKIIFNKTSGATKTGIAAKAFYLTNNSSVNVSYNTNIVSINYPLGTGIGDAKLEQITTLSTSAVENVALIEEIVSLLSLF